MSGRGASAAVLAEWGASPCRPVHLLEVDFNPYLYLTDAGGNIAWNGQTYLASQFLGFEGLAETSELLVNSVTVSLSGVDQAVVAILLQESYLNRRLKIRTAMLDESLGVIADPVLMFDGLMNRPTIVVDPDQGTTLCSVEGVSRWATPERRAGRHSNDTEQQAHFPGDRGFAQVAVIPEQIFWGITQTIGTRGDSTSGGKYGRGRFPRP